ncbi:conserved protein of unknown function [Cupriavidus taiwanensis]|uniref:Uncharacterized protein n=1 Tax=Cupriavidus taiwanensis TaxID=164546 RepID=A0A375IKB8_9BURK|nr:hypothetical protein [Cupriavidus taiwanensis]SPK73695.1 conserved protein of unknown function [Cupriavidus taiwanensis]
MNCKPNDLAIVTRADAVPELIGQIVKVLQASLNFCPYGPVWVVRFQAPKQFPCYFPGACLITTDADCPDAWLRPITGLPVHDDVPEEVTA